MEIKHGPQVVFMLNRFFILILLFTALLHADPASETRELASELSYPLGDFYVDGVKSIAKTYLSRALFLFYK